MSSDLRLAIDFDTFVEAADTGNLVPVWSEALGDLVTPVGVMLPVMEQLRRPFLLESAEGGEQVGRYSFLGGDPFLEVFGDAGGLTLQHAEGRQERLEGDPVADLARVQRRFRSAPVVGAPPFTGGAVGYVAYDAVRWVEEIPASNADEGQWLYLAFYDSVVAFDHLRKRILVLANARVDGVQGRDGLRAKYDQACQRIEELSALISGPVPQARALELIDPADAEALLVESSLDERAFCDAVTSIKEYIRAGDAFQVVLSRRLRCAVTADPLTIYRALRAINPSPYMFCMDTGAAWVIGSSPEMLVRVQEGYVETRPIAGTRPRSDDPALDHEFEVQLRADEKECAEHLMLVDLGRNDIGRVARYGSVEVPEFMTVERYSHVMHLVSSVRGRLRDGFSPEEGFFASFPAGTVSGAPKIRAMEIIDELEPTPRGVYAGAVLYSDFAGSLNSCIAIRTLTLRNGVATVQAGAGIVSDSKPENEFAETGQKAAALLQALAWAEAATRLSERGS